VECNVFLRQCKLRYKAFFIKHFIFLRLLLISYGQSKKTFHPFCNNFSDLQGQEMNLYSLVRRYLILVLLVVAL
jgi:hypothetical protein